MKNQSLTPEEVESLRSSMLIHETEFAYRAGDLLIAENPISGEKRVIGKTDLLTESNKRVLKG